MNRKISSILFSLVLAFSVLTPTAPTFAGDISITAANVVPSSQARLSAQVAGGTITAGQTLYYDPVSGLVKLAKANGVSPINTIFGIAASNAAVNQPILVVTYDPALAIGGTVASGATVWLSGTTAGGMTLTAADVVTGWTTIVLGPGNGSNKIFFQPVAGGAVP